MPPLQLTLVSFERLHALPHPPQLLVLVFVLTHCAPHVVSAHVQLPAEQSGVGCVHVAPFVQVPVLLHDCGVLPLHCFCPGAQVPEQTPFTQV